MKPNINDVVELTVPLPDEAFEPGAVGVVVSVFSDPEEAYEVEFANDDGETIAQLTLLPSQFKVIPQV